jgi:hypothetical protein
MACEVKEEVQERADKLPSLPIARLVASKTWLVGLTQRVDQGVTLGIEALTGAGPCLFSLRASGMFRSLTDDIRRKIHTIK